MILDGYWKSELHRYTLQLRFWSSLCRWTGSFAEHQVNKYLLYSAAIIRKLIEDEVDAKNEFQNSEYGIPELALLHYELPATEYPFDGDEDFILHKVVADNYHAGSRNVTVEAKTICNSIIHSYVWNLAYSEGKRGAAGFLTASDREKDKKLYFVTIRDWIGYIITVKKSALFDRSPICNYDCEKENLQWQNLRILSIKSLGVMNI